MMNSTPIKLYFTAKQREAYRSTRESLFTLFGGAKGGGKTVGGIFIFAHDVLHHTGGTFVVMRRNYTDLHSTTKASFERFFPEELIVSKSSKRWDLVNGNEILWWAADKSRDPNYEKTRGLEATAIMLDEASQTDYELYEVLPSLLRKPAYHIETGKAFHGYIYLTTNPVPGQNYLKRTFIDPRTRKTNDGKHRFILSLPDDNDKLPEGYIERAFSTMSEPMIQMLRYGSWDVEEADFKIILPNDVGALFEHAEAQPDASDIVALGIDIGLGKPDKTVIYGATRAGTFKVVDSFAEYDTMRQTERLYDICRKVHERNGKICIDSAAVGKGISDRLQQSFNLTVHPVMFGETAQEENYQSAANKYANRRAQMYFHARELIQQSALAVSAGKVPEVRLTRDEMLFEELDNTYYMPTDGKLAIEAKDNIKQRLGRSPDHADAFVLCISAWKQTRLSEWALPTPKRRERRGELIGY